MEKTSTPFSFLRPLRKVSSTAKAAPSTVPPSFWTSFRGRGGGAAGGKQVVADDHTLARLHRVFVDFKRVCAVFQRIRNARGLVRELLGLSNGDKTSAEAVCQGGSKNEA